MNIADCPDKLFMEFDMKTIEHLGISMYARLPSVLSEIIANSYDADAHNVTIHINDLEQKEIIITDDGNGMEFSEISNKFLKIGRNRRTDEGKQKTKEGRLVIGKKGIGKLSIFGVAEYVEITTIKNGVMNSFAMDLEDIKQSKNIYYPKQIGTINESVKFHDGTTIVLKNLRRKTPFEIEEIASSLSSRFLIFDEKFKVQIIHNSKEEILVTNELKFKDISKEFSWIFPRRDDTYEYSEKIAGEIITAETPVPSSMKGIYLVSRGKMVNSNEFYGIRADDYAHSYIAGWLNIDYIEDFGKEIISTNRESLNWEEDEAVQLKQYLQKVIREITQDWRQKRSEKKKNKVEETTKIKIDDWLNTVPTYDRNLAKKMIDTVLNSEDLAMDKSATMVNYIQDSFQFESFKTYAAEIESTPVQDQAKIIKLMQDWQLIEQRELYKLALGRIETINKFESYINEDVKEVPTMHQFLKQFPWLLDPRIMEFRDEVRYSQLLKDKFPESREMPENDRRIDFLCVTIADIIFIIELKKPNKKISDKELDQGLDYSAFIESLLGNEHEKKVVTYIVCGGIVNKEPVKKKANSYKQSGDVYMRTYEELLHAAKNYHSEFIQKYQDIQEKEN